MFGFDSRCVYEREAERKQEQERKGGRVRQREWEREDSMTVLTMWKDVRETRLKEAPCAHPIPPLW